MPKKAKEKIDEDEKRFLRFLYQNSDHGIQQIAKVSGLSRQKLLRIKNSIEKNKIIWGHSVIFDYKHIDLNHFTVLFKRSTIPLKKEVIEEVTKGFLEDIFPEGKIKIENVLYVHGDYDWIISFTASDTLTMKQFCDKLIKKYGDFIDSYSVHQTIIPIRKQGIKNPSAQEQGIFL